MIIIIVITIIMGVSFGNKLVVHENFVNIRKVKEGLKKAKMRENCILRGGSLIKVI